ncbi:MAG: endonuclease/exonuclease/phosphatase family protein [Clostridia bacterium]|nr:endonuclease/exonuclease/phosphatase family protein [Clostridia bacterium]
MKRLLVFMMIAALALTALAGCKSTVPEEEGAAADTVVENDTPTPEVEQDAPEKVDPGAEPEVKDEELSEKEPADGEDQTPEATPDTPPEETPAPDNGEEEKEDDEPSANYDEKNKLSLLDYNVRCADDGVGKMVNERAPRLQKLANQLNPDLMGFQEVTPKWRGLLEGYFSKDYDYVYKERNPGGECTPIFWKKDKFQKMDEGYFWLSETPDQESKGWNASYYRICSWVRLKIKSTGKEFLYFNSHWDGGDVVHIGSAQLTLSRARKEGAFSKYAMFLTADFNMLPWGKGYQVLVENGELSDVNYDLENIQDGTVNGYNEDGTSGGRIIDMCFYSPGKAVPVSYRILNEKIDGGYISDHRGLFIEVAVL